MKLLKIIDIAPVYNEIKEMKLNLENLQETSELEQNKLGYLI